MTDKKKLQIFFFFILSCGVFFLLLSIFLPFLQTIFLAVIFATLFYPLYKKILPYCFGKEGIAAGVITVSAVVFIAIPIYILGIQIFEEAKSLYLAVYTDSIGFIPHITTILEGPMKQINPAFTLDLRTYAEDFAGFLLQNTASFLSGTASVLLETILFLFSFFFFLKDGKRFVEGLTALSPLGENSDKELLSSLRGTINAVVRGSLFIGIIQGTLVGIGLYLFHIPDAILWGTVAAVASLIPTIGTGLVNLPAVLYLIYTNDYAAAAGLALWSMFLVGMIDNVLAPLFYKKSGVQAHELLILFSILGGLSYFGPVGFLFGPIILSIFISLLHIYKTVIIKE